MLLRVIRRPATGLMIGAGFGLLMSVPFLFPISIGAAEMVFDVINFPALWLAHIWSATLVLPPRGEIAWVVVPSAMIVAQWSAIGLLLGLWSGGKIDSRLGPPAGS